MIVTQPKHIAEGEGSFPPLVPGSLRVYNMKYCPYAQRTLLTLAFKNITFDVVNINLKRKPAWFLARTALGKVPVLERPDGTTLGESLINMEYLDEAYPQQPLLPKDPWQKAQEKVWVEIFGMTGMKIFKLYRAAEDKEAQDMLLKQVKEGLDRLDAELARRATDFFGGSQPGYLDLAFWPWFERLPCIEILLQRPALTDKQQHLTEWVKKMKEVPAVKALLIAPEEHVKFIQSFLTGEPTYDFTFKHKI
ncbi:Glutathione S-transferase N-terminal [Trinorchestia longiramus]|nr:Glutathione S-transferase N-terminal [Trinorchestia longiramus]